MVNLASSVPPSPRLTPPFSRPPLQIRVWVQEPSMPAPWSAPPLYIGHSQLLADLHPPSSPELVACPPKAVLSTFKIRRCLPSLPLARRLSSGLFDDGGQDACSLASCHQALLPQFHVSYPPPPLLTPPPQISGGEGYNLSHAITVTITVDRSTKNH